MYKKISIKMVLISFMFVTLCFVASCGKKESKKETIEEPGTVHLLNGFEAVSDLYSFKPTVTQTVATMDIVGKGEGRVKKGEASLRYNFQKGNWPEILLYARESSYPQLDISNLNKINVSVYNDTDQEVEATLSVIVTGRVTLLSERYTLEPNAWNDLGFRLSALACKYNEDKIVGFALRIEAEKSSVFYVDDWTATMGAENTEEDNKWEPLLKDIIKRIDKLPKEISLADGKELEELYMDYASLPELYRNIIPNYDVLRETIAAYAELKIASEEEGLETKFLVFDEFYGIGQIKNDVNGAYPILYQTDVKFEDEAGSIMITFDGSTQESYFAYTTPLDAKLYDYVEMSFYNEDVNRKVIYFNWNQRLIVEPNTWGTIRLQGEEFRSDGRIIVDTINEYGTRINSSGRVYFSTLCGTRRDLLTELKKLPNASDFVMPRDIKYLTLIEKTMDLYKKLPDSAKINIPKELIGNLEKCHAKIDGYRTVFDTTTEEIQFGTPDCKSVGEAVVGTDDQYGPIVTLKYIAKADGDYAAGFQFNKDFSDSKNMFFYIYNPKNAAQIMYLYADGNWKDLGARTLEPGWNEIQLPSDVKVNNFIFGLFPKNADIVGEWKVTSVYEVADKIIDAKESSEVKALLEALPDASTILMPRDLKYVATIDAAKEAYDALSKEAKTKISASLKNRLDACLKAIEGYNAVVNAITDEMTVGTPDCVCAGTLKRETDKEYGPVFGLTVTAEASGDYAAGFQVNKDISNGRNMFFYIYNPQASAQNMYLYADPSWKDLGPQTLNPGWNKVEIPNSVQIKQYVFGLFPKGADVVGNWKITSFYSVADSIVSKEEAKAVEAMITALPNAYSIKMPEHLKYVATIEEAKGAYEALSAEGKQAVSTELKQKLNECVDKIKGYTTPINARTDEMSVGTPDCACKGTVSRLGHNIYGPTFNLQITEAASGDYAAGFQVNKDISNGRNMFFYIYNPQTSAQNMYLYADPSWKDLGARVLEPGWNRVDLPNDAQIEQYVFGLFPKGTEVIGEWNITSFYGVSDSIIAQEKADMVETLITALPSPDIIEMPSDIRYVSAIDEAKTAYDALSKEAKGHISVATKEKLNACVSKINGFTAVVNVKTDDIMVGSYDCSCQGSIIRDNDGLYGPIVRLKITEEATVNYAGGFQVNKSLADSENIFFYMYNPLEKEQVMFMYADGNWTDMGTQVLVPGWNKIELPSDKKVNNRIFGLFPLGAEVSGEWKITSFYGVSDEALKLIRVAEVEALIEALPKAETLTLENKEAVEAAKAAYEALDEETRQKVTNVNKLNACLEKIAELDTPSNVISYSSTTNHRFDYYSDETNAAYAVATLEDVEVAGQTAKWSAIVNVTQQNGGYARAYQGLELTVAKLQEYKADGYTHLRIPYYLEAPADTTIHVHSDGWEWNYKKAADAVRRAWTNFDYPIDDLLLKPTSEKTVLEGINTTSGAYGIINIEVNATGTYKLYLGEAEMIKPEEKPVPKVEYSTSPTPHFDYYNDAVNAAYAGATLGDVEVGGQIAKWFATVNVTQQNGGYLRAYQALNLTVAQLNKYKQEGYTHIRIPYYLVAPADTTIHVHSDGWEWNYKKAADAVRGAWTNFDYPIDDLLLEPSAGKTVLEGINGANGAYGIINIGVNAVGTYKLYLGECEMVTLDSTPDAKLSGLGFDGWSGNSGTWIGSNGSYAERLAVSSIDSFKEKPAILHATITHKADGSSANFAANSLDMFYSCQSTLGVTKEEVQSWIDTGYTKLQFSYYLTGAGATTIWASYEGKYNGSWEQYLNVVAEKDKWATFEIKLSDVLIQLDSANYSGYLFRVQPTTEGTYEFYLGEAKAIK